ncbi:MAG: hypothetical protein JST66_08735 [Bacteroidetes bacterium]|nr:hypothetical protein [Bacteroidota bacterium]
MRSRLMTPMSVGIALQADGPGAAVVLGLLGAHQRDVGQGVVHRAGERARDEAHAYRVGAHHEQRFRIAVLQGVQVQAGRGERWHRGEVELQHARM